MEAGSSWQRPPDRGYYAEDLDHIPDLPAHTELIDGSLVIPARQSIFHSRTISLLSRGLEAACPPELEICERMTIVLAPRQRPEPDLIVVKRQGWDPARSFYSPEDVVLAVEVMSPESEIRDRDRKPQLYGRAGISLLWRVEPGDDGRIVVYTYELDMATRVYAGTGIYRDRLVQSRPFPMDVMLTL